MIPALQVLADMVVVHGEILIRWGYSSAECLQFGVVHMQLIPGLETLQAVSEDIQAWNQWQHTRHRLPTTSSGCGEKVLLT